MSFREKWLEAVDKKGSVLCAGLDPAEFAMGRGEDGLPEGVDKLSWARSYIMAVAPYCAAVKPNFQYWKSIGGITSLHLISTITKDLGLVVIDDSKLADIGSTNDTGMFYSSQWADAVTYSPFAGNIEEASRQAHARNLGIIGMCLMSNPEFEKIKNMQISYEGKDIAFYDFLARESNKYSLDGIVIGAPSTKNHISVKEIETVRKAVGDEMFVLLPGVGAQGGEADAIWRYFSKTNVIVNVGRALMFPYGSNSTPEQQAEAAKNYKTILNKLRA